MELEPRMREVYDKLFEETADIRYLARANGLKSQETRKYDKGDEQNARRK